MTARQVEIHPEALAEAEAAVAWYAERSSRAPEVLIGEIDRAIKSILQSPNRWPVDDDGCRRFLSSVFLTSWFIGRKKPT